MYSFNAKHLAQKIHFFLVKVESLKIIENTYINLIVLIIIQHRFSNFSKYSKTDWIHHN